MQNQRVVIAARPAGMVRESDFQFESLPVETMGPGDVLVEVMYLSLDPYMRGMMRERTPYGDRRPIPIGGSMIGEGVGRVARSNSPQLSTGDIAAGPFGWQSVAVSKADKCRKVDLSLGPVTTALGVLGMPGLTAYFGLIEICHPRSGETVFVSGAAGAVGSCAGQIAKVLGCRVVGSAGSDEKVAKLTSDYGFDAAFNYKATTAYEIKLKELCPNGIDCYFDNVGGAITDAVFQRINTGARISICGQISIYNDEPDTAPRWLSQLLVKQAKAEGFLVTKFYPRTAEAIAQLAAWIRAGKVKYEETIVEGLENAPKAFMGMFQGENRGKLLVKIRD